jgi:serine/threonine protein kinase
MEPIAFGRYRLLDRLGAGGMAQVFRAVSDAPDGSTRSVVVKRMLPHLSGNRDFVRLLIDEARLSSRLHHPAIVQVHEFGDVDGEYYIAMEHVEGRNLAALLEQLSHGRRTLPHHLACHVVRHVAAALAYAHSLVGEDGRPLEIIHRDVSPSNILVSQNGAIKLLDFGIAKAATGIRQEETRTGVVKGKVSYMSPEQADGRDVDRRSDIFALGVVFWECLTMRRLFRGTDDLHTLRLVREAEIEPPSLMSDIDPRIEAVVMKMLARDREARYSSCQEIVAALSSLALNARADAATMHEFLAELGEPTESEPPPAESDVLTVSLLPPARRAATKEHAASERKSWRWLPWVVLSLAAMALFLPRSRKPATAPAAPPHSVSLPRARSPVVSPPRAASPLVAPSPPAQEQPRTAVAAAPPSPVKQRTRRRRQSAVRASASSSAVTSPPAKPAQSSPEIHDPFSER